MIKMNRFVFITYSNSSRIMYTAGIDTVKTGSRKIWEGLKCPEIRASILWAGGKEKKMSTFDQINITSSPVIDIHSLYVCLRKWKHEEFV